MANQFHNTSKKIVWILPEHKQKETSFVHFSFTAMQIDVGRRWPLLKIPGLMWCNELHES